MEANPAPDDEISLLDLALVVAENIKLLIFAPLAVGLCALGISYLIPPTYTAITRIMPPQQQQSSAAALLSQLGGALGGLAGAAGGAAGIRNPSDTYVAMIKSRTVADALIDQFDLLALYDVDYKEDARKQLTINTTAKSGRDGMITIEVEDHDPVRAAKMANAYVEQLGELMQTLAITEAGQRRVFFEKRLKQARDDLTRAEIALRSSGVSEATLRSTPQAALEPLARLRAQVTASEVKIASMRGAMTESNAELQQSERELAALRAQLAKAEQSDPAKATGSGADYIGKYREFKYQETLFELMARQYEMARLDEAREGAIIQVIDPALPPERKSKPKKALIAIIATLATGFLLLVFVFVRNAYRQASASPESSEKLARLRSLLRLKS